MVIDNVRDLTPSSLTRRTSGSKRQGLNAPLLIANGVDVEIVQACMGHVSASTVMYETGTTTSRRGVPYLRLSAPTRVHQRLRIRYQLCTSADRL
ncbi:hypothetical protein [Humibacillus xanthopallidus]|uniref:hypothetical protein n=1 Tax=Humibacillus xanthopallidus TaxID=412689 RepID=UPI00384CEFF3